MKEIFHCFANPRLFGIMITRGEKIIKASSTMHSKKSNLQKIIQIISSFHFNLYRIFLECHKHHTSKTYTNKLRASNPKIVKVSVLLKPDIKNTTFTLIIYATKKHNTYRILRMRSYRVTIIPRKQRTNSSKTPKAKHIE